jgi:hypothetical protein
MAKFPHVSADPASGAFLDVEIPPVAGSKDWA